MDFFVFNVFLYDTKRLVKSLFGNLKKNLCNFYCVSNMLSIVENVFRYKIKWIFCLRSVVLLMNLFL